MKKVLVVVGPTGAGKSDLGIQLAKKYHGEIISGDSIQVYRELNIGSAKVTEEEMEGIPHHLINILNLEDNYSVKDFQDNARRLIHEITSRNKLPIIVGGTGFYIKAALYDYYFPEEEKIDMSEYEALTNETLYHILEREDPKTLEKIHLNNRKRLLRAVEMVKTGNKRSDVLKDQKHEPIYDLFVVGLTMERSILYDRINQRVLKMMENGLKDEMDGLISKYPDLFDYQGLQGIGYKEWKRYYQNEISLEEVIDMIQLHSRQFAKKQYTWFNNQMNIHWADIYQSDFPESILKDIELWQSTKSGKD